MPSTKFREDRRNSNGQPFQIAHMWSLAPFFFLTLATTSFKMVGYGGQ